MNKIEFSVITPCFRGGVLLRRAYNSLLRQHGFCFEWIIIDDYSNDQGVTKSVIDAIVDEAPFPVIVKYLDSNFYGSKSVFIGASIASADYAFILDQDDMLSDDAMLICRRLIDNYRSVDGLAGVCGRCVDMKGQLIGKPFGRNELVSNEWAIRHELKMRGEMFQCTDKNLLMKFFSGMKPGYTNGWAWSRIAKIHSFVYTDNVLRIYDTGNPNSTSNLKKMVYLDAQYEQIIGYLSMGGDYMVMDSYFSVRLLTQVFRISRHLHIGLPEVVASIPKNLYFLLPGSIFVGFMKSLLDKRRGVV